MKMPPAPGKLECQEKFDAKVFDWKKAIYEQGNRLTKVEVILEEHIRIHDRKVTWLFGILGSIIGGIAIWVFRSWK